MARQLGAHCAEVFAGLQSALIAKAPRLVVGRLTPPSRSRGGTLVVFSIYGGPLERFDPGIFYEKEVSVVGSKGAGNCYREAIRLLETRKVTVSSLVTHRLPLERAAEGFALMTDRGADAVRIVIRPWSDE